MKIINSTFSSFVYGAATRLPLSRCGQLPRTVYLFAVGTILNAIEESGFEVYFDVPRDPLIASSIDRSKVIRKRRVRCKKQCPFLPIFAYFCQFQKFNIFV